MRNLIKLLFVIFVLIVLSIILDFQLNILVLFILIYVLFLYFSNVLLKNRSNLCILIWNLFGCDNYPNLRWKWICKLFSSFNLNWEKSNKISFKDWEIIIEQLYSDIIITWKIWKLKFQSVFTLLEKKDWKWKYIYLYDNLSVDNDKYKVSNWLCHIWLSHITYNEKNNVLEWYSYGEKTNNNWLSLIFEKMSE